MNYAELEEILSAYIDDELSPQNKNKVEALVKTDARAKSILDGYMSVRRAFQLESGSLRYKVPEGFAANVLAAIDAQAPQSKAFESGRYETVSRLRNPRIYAYPLAILICALLIGIFYRTDDQQTADGRRQTSDGGQQMEQASEQRIYAPLAGDAGTVSPPEISDQPEALQNLKLVCQTENTSSVSTIFARIFAKHEIRSTSSTSGTNTVVYEISVTPDTLRRILDDLQASAVEVTGKTENLGTEKPVKVFFQVDLNK